MDLTKERALRILHKGRETEKKKAELTVNGEQRRPLPKKRKKAAAPKPNWRTKSNRTRFTRSTFQARLSPHEWRPLEHNPKIMASGTYRTWVGLSKVEEGKKAVFLASKKNVIEAPSWSIMAQRLGIT